MRSEMTLPSLGDDNDAVQGAIVTGWLAQVGDELKVDDELLEITTDKAAFVVLSTEAGRLAEQLVAEGENIKVGDKVAVFETQ